MRKLAILLVCSFMGITSLSAQSGNGGTPSSGGTPSTGGKPSTGGREIPIKDDGEDESPTARSINLQPVSAYLDGKVITVVFNRSTPSAQVSVTYAPTGADVYSETHLTPTIIRIDLNAENAGDYNLKIESGRMSKSGDFTL